MSQNEVHQEIRRINLLLFNPERRGVTKLQGFTDFLNAWDTFLRTSPGSLEVTCDEQRAQAFSNFIGSMSVCEDYCGRGVEDETVDGFVEPITNVFKFFLTSKNDFSTNATLYYLTLNKAHPKIQTAIYGLLPVRTRAVYNVQTKSNWSVFLKEKTIKQEVENVLKNVDNDTLVEIFSTLAVEQSFNKENVPQPATIGGDNSVNVFRKFLENILQKSEMLLK